MRFELSTFEGQPTAAPTFNLHLVNHLTGEGVLSDFAITVSKETHRALGVIGLALTADKHATRVASQRVQG